MPVRKRPTPKWKNEAQRIHLRSRDWGWVFSQRVIERLAKRKGLPPAEVERWVDLIAEEMRRVLVEGHPVGLPRCPVMYIRRCRCRASFKFKGETRKVRTTRIDLPKLWTHTPRPFREDVDKYAIDRGRVRDQYEAERLRITGKPRTKYKPTKPPLLADFNPNGITED